jgi:serine kinase of HPr protein (carbohydrate metabolism regulator)
MPYPAILRDKPHLTLICGRKGSGKTALTIKLLKSPRGWRNVYDKVIIISPTFMLQPIWGQLSPKGITVHLEFQAETIIELMAAQTETRDRRVLLLLDDLGEDVCRSKDATAVFHKMIANSRHLSISIVWLAQKITQIPTYARANADSFISFASLATRERDALFNEVSMVDKRTFADMFVEATTDQYSTFAATFKAGQLHYFKDLETPIIK